MQASTGEVPKAVIAPHAGYVYSGPIAAHAYALLAPARGTIERVVLLGPTHRVAVRGIAMPDVGAFSTPLATSSSTARRLKHARVPQIIVSDERMRSSIAGSASAFLQSVLGSFKLVPLAVGYAQPAKSRRWSTLWGGPETLIVVSSDLSQYLGYSEAKAMDQETCEAVLALRTDIDHEQACGATPVAGLAFAAPQEARRSFSTSATRRHGGRQAPRRRLCLLRIL